MLIKALCDYYDVLEKDGKVLPEGKRIVPVSFAVKLTPAGEISGIIDLRTPPPENGKGKAKGKPAPKGCLFPREEDSTQIKAYAADYRPLYAFGLEYNGGKLSASAVKAAKSHKAFVEYSCEILKGLSSPVIDAYRNFVETWNPEEEEENQFLSALGKNYANGTYFAFCLESQPEIMLQDDEIFNKRWNEIFHSRDDGESVITQCCIYGDNLPIARIHNKIMGIPGGKGTGNALVCFNKPSDSSYGKDSSYNSNISDEAALKYVDALNYLLTQKDHNARVGDISVVYWALGGSEEEACKVMKLCSNDDSVELNEHISEILKCAACGRNVTEEDINSIDDIDSDTDFYIAGLKPESARISTKFVWHKQFGTLLMNIVLWQNEMAVRDNGRFISIRRIAKELVSPVSKAAIDSSLLSKLYEAIILGHDYPHEMLAAAVRRVKTDRNTEQNSFVKMNDVRIGIIRGCINRRNRLQGSKKEEITMALDETNTNPAYLCGRIFALLEMIQQNASGGGLNRTITDAYFSSAASYPAAVFPKLIRLSQNHLAKLDGGSAVHFSKLLQSVMDGLPGEFPQTLSLTDQGKFIIGYYQQRSDIYKAKGSTADSNEETEENQDE